MPRATLTSRVLKNKDTGLEIYVPNYNVTKELLGSIVHYQVVLASNLACFKSPSHKESDVVQYSIERKLNEFEELRNKMTQLFPGTMLPTIHKKSIIVNDLVLRERRASLDNFMKSIASVPKLSTCVPVLIFLGVEPLRAKKFSKGEPLESRAAGSSTGAAAVNDGDNDYNAQEDLERPEAIVFGEDEDSGNEDLFGDDDVKAGTDDLFGNYDDDDDDVDSRTGSNFKVFEGQDLKRDLTEEDEKDFESFMTNTITTKKEVVRTQQRHEGEEDNSDLFQIEDDLDKLMTVKTETQKKKVEEVTSSSKTPTTSLSSSSSKVRPPKPTPSPSSKPIIPSKPNKPQIATKPKNLTTSSLSSVEKPSIPQKTKPSSSSSSSSSSKIVELKDDNPSLSSASPNVKDGLSGGGTIDAVADLGQDDIMKYLQDNIDSNAEEVDLFS